MLLSSSVTWPTNTERNNQAQNMEVMKHSTFLTFSRCSNLSDSKSRASPLCVHDKESIQGEEDVLLPNQNPTQKCELIATSTSGIQGLQKCTGQCILVQIQNMEIMKHSTFLTFSRCSNFPSQCI